MTTLSLILLSTFIISLGSLVGVLTLAVKPKTLDRFLMTLVSLSAGVLMATAFLHLLPESVKLLPGQMPFTFTLFSFIGFFLIEKLLHWHHCHHISCHQHTFGYMNLIGDSLHNFIDGLIIAAAFASGFRLGWLTVLAIALHEIPQEISDFGVLLYSGWSRRKALISNFLVSLTSVAGGLIGYLLSDLHQFSAYLMPIAAGGFIYIAASDLLPEMRKESSIKKSLFNFSVFLIGIVLMLIFKN
ncbi:MAG: ZIP family metal transporter [Patescibacteria group bacterium]|nr:ZIP family metal transporter [Patescibacteria group bacterium]